MSAVDRDSFEIEQFEGGEREKGGSSKLAPRSISNQTAAKVNRLPAVMLRGGPGVIEADRYLSESSRRLQEFVAPLEERIRSFGRYRGAKYNHSARAHERVAQLVLEVIRQLAQRETGVFNLEAPVARLLSTLFAGSVEVGIVTGLVRRARKALLLRDKLDNSLVNGAANRKGINPALSRGLNYDVSRELDELLMLLKWYVRRKVSIASIELAPNDDYLLLDSGRDSALPDRDLLFALDVLHDHQVFGVKGCLVTCGLKLLGRDGESLWLRVSVLRDGEPVMARQNWSSWSDPGGVCGTEVVLPEFNRFCSLVPIRPNSQRLVIDEVRAFVPYAALNLPTGRSQVEIVVNVIDSDGVEVLKLARDESICVPAREVSLSSVPAPHALGIWPHDVVSGDKLSELSVSSGFITVAGWERHAISVAFDLSLFMHAGESVTLECRFLNAKGDVVELSSLGMPFIASESNIAVESLSSYRYRRVLHPRGAWALYQGLCIDIPVEFLQLAPGLHDITCELVVVSADERVLCGDMSRVEVQVPDREARRGLNGSELSHNAYRGTLELDSLEVESSWQFGADESVRVQARFSPKGHKERLAELAAGRVGELFSPYRVELSLERDDGHVLLQAYSDPLGMSFKPVTRSVCIDPYSGTPDHTVVCNFKRDEVLAWSLAPENPRSNSKVRIFARVTALTLTGEVLLSESRELFVKPVQSDHRKVLYVSETVASVVDVTAYINTQGDRLSSQAVVNLTSSDIGYDTAQVQFVLITPSGRREIMAKRDLPHRQGGVWTRQVTGLCQYSVDCDYDMRSFSKEVGGSSGFSIEVGLFSDNGVLIDSVIQPIKSTGVLSEVDENAADFDSDLADDGHRLVEATHSAVTNQNGPSSKGLWGRLFSRN